MAEDQKLNLTVQVNAETGQIEVVSQKLGALGVSAEKTGQSFKNLTGGASDLLRTMLPFATAAGIVSFFTSSVKAAEEQNEAFRRLKFTVEGTGQSWEKHRAQVEQWIGAVQNSTRFSNNEAIGTLERLTRVTGSLSQAQAASTLAMNMSVAGHMSLEESTALVTDLLIGQDRALRLVKRSFGEAAGSATTTQEALDLLSVKLRGAATGSKGLTDSSSKLSNSFGEFKEVVGNSFIPALISIFDFTANIIKQFDKLGIYIASFAAKMTVVFGAGYKESMKAINDETERMLEESNKKSSAVLQEGHDERLSITKSAIEKMQTEEEQAMLDRETKYKENAQKLAQIEAALDKEIASSRQQGFDRDRQILNAEVAEKKAAIDKEIKGELQKQQAYAKLRDFEKAGTHKLAIDQGKIKQEYALQTMDLAIQTLQTLNSLGDTGSKSERVRAKALLLLQQSVAIGWAVVAAAKVTAETANPAIGGALLAAQTGLILAQTAAGFKRIDQSASNEASGIQAITTQSGVAGIDLGAPTSGGVGGGGGTVSLVSGSSGGGGGGGGSGNAIVINVGGIVANFDIDKIDGANVKAIMLSIYDQLRRGTIEGVQMAVALKNTADKNSTLSV